jgi:hypothetical protein
VVLPFAPFIVLRPACASVAAVEPASCTCDSGYPEREPAVVVPDPLVVPVVFVQAPPAVAEPELPVELVEEVPDELEPVFRRCCARAVDVSVSANARIETNRRGFFIAPPPLPEHREKSRCAAIIDFLHGIYALLTTRPPTNPLKTYNESNPDF